MKYAITAVTGHFGQTAMKTLAELVSTNDIIGLARNTEKASKIVPEGVNVRPGDYNDVDTLTESLKGIDRLLFISSQPGGDVPRAQQHLNVIEAAKKAGVKWIGYTSFPHADQAVGALASDHLETEKALAASGINYSFLRNNWYLENEMDSIKGALAGQPFVYGAGKGRVGWALESDYAEAAAKVLVSDQPKEIYEFAGAPKTYADLAHTIEQLTSQKFEVKSLSITDYRQKLEDGGIPTEVAGVITSIQTLIHDGDLDEETSDLPTVLGRPLLSLSESLKTIIQ